MRSSQAIAGLVERLGNCVYGDAYGSGLKPAQWSALRYFATANRFSRTTSAFARYHGTTAAAASQTIAALVRRNLLDRQRDAADKRRHHLNLTQKARRLIPLDPMADLAEASRILDQKELALLTESLEKILGHLLQNQSGKKFGFCEDCRFLECRRRNRAQGDTFHCAQADETLAAEELTQLCVNFVVADPVRAC